MVFATHEAQQSDVSVQGDDASAIPRRRQRVAVIGAGPCGLSALYAFHKLENVEVVCFERQGQIGGQWNYDPRIGKDEYGLPIHSSMYPHLFSNGPKEVGSEYPNYTYLEHFGGPVPSCPPRAAVEDYIKGRARKYDLERLVRFNTIVENVDWDSSSQKFSISVKDLPKQAVCTEVFDFLIVATGHFSVPEFPQFPGYESFPGKLLHSKDFREASEFNDQTVLIVGGSLSAEDIGMQCYKFGAKRVIITNRSPMNYPWPEGVSEVPLLTHVVGSTAHFTGGLSAEVDAIISCTGYKYVFPFLPESMKLKSKNVLCPPKLYKGVFWVDNPKLMYLGMQNQVYTFIMFDLQAQLARDAVIKKFLLPGTSEMEEEIEMWRQKELAMHETRDWLVLQTEYVEELNDITAYCAQLPVGCLDLFEEAENDKIENLITFRDKQYRSRYSFCSGVPPAAPWIDCKEEQSLQDYLQIGIDKSVAYPQMCLPVDEYTKLESATIKGWGLHVRSGEAAGQYVASSVPILAGAVAMVLPPYKILTWQEAKLEDNDLIIQVRGGGASAARFSCALSRSSLDCFLNHSCDPNLLAIILPDFSVTMVAARQIEPFEAFCWDYNTTEEDLVEFNGQFDCACGFSCCQKVIRGSRFLDCASTTASSNEEERGSLQ